MTLDQLPALLPEELVGDALPLAWPALAHEEAEARRRVRLLVRRGRFGQSRASTTSLRIAPAVPALTATRLERVTC